MKTKLVYSKELEDFIQKLNKEFELVQFDLTKKDLKKKTKLIVNSTNLNISDSYKKIYLEGCKTFKKYKKYLKKFNGNSQTAYSYAINKTNLLSYIGKIVDRYA